MGAASAALEARRAALIAKAAADRAALGRQLEPLTNVPNSLGRFLALKSQLPGKALSAGLGISALLLALPRLPLVRTGLALIQLASSVRRLLSRR